MQPVHIQDEFAPLKVALVHGGTNAVTLSTEEQRRLIPPSIPLAFPGGHFLSDPVQAATRALSSGLFVFPIE